MSDRSKPTSGRARPIVRVTYVVLGVASILYAISDHPFYGDAPGFGTVQTLIAALGVGLCGMSLLPAPLATRGLVITISAGIALLIGEVAAEKMLAPKIRTAFVADPDVIFRLAPNRTAECRLPAINGGHRIVQHVNSDGFRGPELAPPGSGTRVVVYGDSFIHAYYSSLEATFPSRLEDCLERDLGGPIEVINAGVSSYGPDQVLVRMRSELAFLQPDLVVVAVFAGNDYGDLLRNRMFELDDDGELRANDWRLSDEQAIRLELNERESMLRRALRKRLGAKRHGIVQDAEGDRLQSLIEFCLAEAHEEYEEAVVQGSDVITNTKNDYFSADVCLEPKSASALYRIALMERVLDRIKGLADDADVPIAFLFIPHPLDASGEFLGGRVDMTRYPDYSPENLTAPLNRWAEGAGAHHLDLLDTFRGPEAAGLYLRGDDDHWNEAGRSLAAERMAEFLLQNDLLVH